MRLPEPLDFIEVTGIDPKTLTVVDDLERIFHNDLTIDGAEWEEGDTIFPVDPYKLKILVVTPMHPSYGIRPQAIESISKAIHAYDGVVDWVINHGDNPHIKPYENITYQHNKARQMVLSRGYDALLSIEADMIVPPDTIAKLIECDADIAYGLYVSRHKPFRWLAFKELNVWGGKSVSLDHTGADARAAWGKIIDVAGIGMGCTLIKRRVFERLRFRLHDGSHSWIQEEHAQDYKTMGIDPTREQKNLVCDDYLLALDAQHYGMSQRCNLSLVCGHIDNDRVLWPDPEADKFIRAESIKEI